MEGSLEYEEECAKDGIVVNIKRIGDDQNYGPQNLQNKTEKDWLLTKKQYKRCVLEKLLKKYANTKIVLDVGGDSSVENADLFSELPNVFAIGVPPKPEDDEPYLEMLRQRKINRLKEMAEKQQETKGKVDDDLIKAIKDEENSSNESTQLSIDQIREYYRGEQGINKIGRAHV